MLQIRKSAEDYLETMLILLETHGYIRSIDIAEALCVKKPSVTYMTKRLREAGYITMDESSLITLTDSGMDIATHIYERHKTLSTWLMTLGVPESVALEDACKIEHDLSEESYQAIRRYIRTQ